MGGGRRQKQRSDGETGHLGSIPSSGRGVGAGGLGQGEPRARMPGFFPSSGNKGVWLGTVKGQSGLGFCGSGLQSRLSPHSIQTVDETQVYSEAELKRFEAELAAQEAELSRRAEQLRRQHQDLAERQVQLDAQKKEYQHVSWEASLTLVFPILGPPAPWAPVSFCPPLPSLEDGNCLEAGGLSAWGDFLWR